MLDRLRSHAQSVAPRSHAPYSGQPVGVAVLLSTGEWTAAPRLENASFPLTIPALQGALALTALADGDAAAIASTRPLSEADLAFVGQMLGGEWTLAAPDVAVRHGVALPVLGAPLRLTLDLPAPPDAAGGAALAFAAASRAVVPASDFPVGAAVEDTSGRLVVGANVETDADWTRGLCAERTALVAARAAGLGPVRRLYVACGKAPGGTPCGGCRQVIAELAWDAEIVIWQGGAPPALTTPSAMLPGAFRGESLAR